MLRSLTWFWRIHVAVALGAAVAAAVLTGALLVGDSVRGSLRDLALERLGRVDLALLSERFFREDLAPRLTAELPETEAVAGILLRGSATHGTTGALASRIAILGVDHRFAGLFPEPAAGEPTLGFDRAPGQMFPSVLLSQALARELDAGPGDAVVLSFPRVREIPAGSVVGQRDPEDLLQGIRCIVTAVLPGAGAGDFALSAHQTRPRNAFVHLPLLQRALQQEGRANALFLAGVPGGTGSPSVAAADARLRATVDPDDLGIRLRPLDGVVSVESREFVLRPALAEAVEAAADRLGWPSTPVQVYLANQLSSGDRSIPYSMVAAVDPPADPSFRWLRLGDGSPAPRLEDDEILLNRWAADDLGVSPGDTVEISYYQVGDREDLVTRGARFRIRGVVRMEGLGADPDLTPEYPGVHDARRMSDWDPPFPVDLGSIRPRDEAYWDQHRGTPKAFVSAEAGRRLWTTRFGTLTAIRVAPPEGTGSPVADAFATAMREEANPARLDLRFLPIRREALEAAAGATDFSGLFLGFSMFLIASAVLLAGMLFRLGVEQRSSEVGLLLAVGYPARRVRRRFLAEGLVVSAAGAALGLGAGAGYAALMMAGLRTWWLPAVGTSSLYLHVEPDSLALGWTISVAVVLLAVGWSVRAAGRVPAARLLSGGLRGAGGTRGGGWMARLLAAGGLLGAAGLTAAAVGSGRAASPGLAFGAGVSLLTGGLAAFSLWCRRPRGARLRPPRRRGLPAMAARNTAWSPGRSLLCAALVASACFVLVVVGAFRGEGDWQVEDLESGAGGYELIAESDVAILQDLGLPADRVALGLPLAGDPLEGATVMPFALQPGDDASCLNLYRPRRPRILGVPPAQRQRGGFAFQALASGTPEPWSLLEEELEPGVVPAFGDANSVQWILHLGLGQDLAVESETGDRVRLRIVGLLRRSVFQSELLISEAAFRRLFPGRSGYRVFLIDTPPGRAAGVPAALEDALGGYGLDVSSTGERLAAFHQVETTYLSTFQALGGLGLLLGTAGLGVVLLRNVLERRSELAALRAVGFRGGTLGALVLGEIAVLLFIGLGIGTVAALLAAAPHLREAGSHVPWASLTGTLAAVAAAGLLSGAAAVRAALRAPLLPLLKAER